MHGELTYPPTAPDTTYILHGQFTEADVLAWAPLVAYRLVVVCENLPTLTSRSEDVVVIDSTLQTKRKRDYHWPEALLRWRDRERALPVIAKMPTPLALAFLRCNCKDATLWRLLASVSYMLPDEYMHALFAFGVKPQEHRVVWPKKNAKGIPTPDGFRESDIYAEGLIHLSREVANEVRVKEPEALPVGVKKRKEGGVEWV